MGDIAVLPPIVVFPDRIVAWCPNQSSDFLHDCRFRSKGLAWNSSGTQVQRVPEAELFACKLERQSRSLPLLLGTQMKSLTQMMYYHVFVPIIHSLTII